MNTERRVTQELVNSHEIILVTLLAISVLLYVLLDGFDLGIGILFGLTRQRKSDVAPC